MAILEDVPGLSVVVKVDGKNAMEYDDDDEPDGDVPEHQAAVTVHKYIESVSDTDYGLELAVEPVFDFDFPTLSCQLYIDGRLVDRPILRASAIKVLNGHVREKRTMETYGTPQYGLETGTSTTIRKYRFAKIDVNEKNTQTIKEDTGRMKKVGEIALHVFRGSETRRSTAKGAVAKLASKKVEVHEKALKGDAKSHSTLYGPSTAKTITWWSSEFLDGANSPIAIFKFKYRSREALKQLMIIDRTPSPSREPEPVVAPNPMDIEALDDEQREQLAKFMKQLTGANQPAKIKRERDQDGNGESSKRRKSGKKVTIDLTGDSDEDN